MSEGTPILAGNWQDDDGVVLESHLEENTDGQKDPPPATKSFTPVDDHPRVYTRIIGAELIVVSGIITAGIITTNSQIPVQVLWPDADRVGVHIRVNSLAANLVAAGLGSDVLRFSSDPGLLNSKHQAPGLTTSQPIANMLHTGALWIFAPETNNTGTGGGMQVWITAITK